MASLEVSAKLFLPSFHCSNIVAHRVLLQFSTRKLVERPVERPQVELHMTLEVDPVEIDLADTAVLGEHHRIQDCDHNLPEHLK